MYKGQPPPRRQLEPNPDFSLATSVATLFSRGAYAGEIENYPTHGRSVLGSKNNPSIKIQTNYRTSKPLNVELETQFSLITVHCVHHLR